MTNQSTKNEWQRILDMSLKTSTNRCSYSVSSYRPYIDPHFTQIRRSNASHLHNSDGMRSPHVTNPYCTRYQQHGAALQSAPAKKWRVDGWNTNVNLLHCAAVRVKNDVIMPRGDRPECPKWLWTTCKTPVWSEMSLKFTFENCTSPQWR